MNGKHAMSGLDRRTFVKGLAAAGLVSAMPPGFGGQRSMRPTALVIGAGIAGLSAAYELRKAGFDVAIFEKWDYTGGRMREAWMGPLYGLTHAAGVWTNNKEQFALAAELGIADQLGGESGAASFDNGIGIYDFTAKWQLKDLLKVPGFSAETKRKLPSLQHDLDKIRQEVDFCQLATGASYDDESLGDYYERMLGKASASEVIRYWIEPMLEWAGWPTFQTSKIGILPIFADPSVDFVVPRGGIGVLTRKLGSMLPVQHRTTVRYITPPDTHGRHTVHYLTPTLEEKSLTPDVVVVATEGRFVSKIVRGLSPEQRAFFDPIDTTVEAILWYVLDEKAAPKEPLGAAYVPSHPDPWKRRVNSWSVNPPEPHNHNRPATIRIALSRPETSKWQMSGKTLPEYCEPLIRHFYPAFDMKYVTDIVNYTCQDVLYIPVGYVKKMAAIVREQEKSKRGLYFAGEYVSGTHTGAACASGRTVGRLIARHWKA